MVLNSTIKLKLPWFLQSFTSLRTLFTSCWALCKGVSGVTCARGNCFDTGVSKQSQNISKYFFFQIPRLDNLPTPARYLPHHLVCWLGWLWLWLSPAPPSKQQAFHNLLCQWSRPSSVESWHPRYRRPDETSGQRKDSRWYHMLRYYTLTLMYIL